MTNKEYITAINERKSRRSYSSRPLNSQIIDVIKQLVDYVNENEGLDFRFIENAKPAISLFSGKFSMIAICGDDTERMRVKSGYWGEMIVLQCVYHGLGTCWVNGTYDENKMISMLNLPRNKRLYAAIVIGNVKSKLTPKEKVMYKITHKQDKPYQKMMEVCDKKLPPYYEYGMKMVELAPSGANSKPVHFKYENDIIRGYVDAPYSDKSIDFGIAQLHFELGASAKGVKGSWDFTGKFCPENSKVIKFPDNKIEEE